MLARYRIPIAWKVRELELSALEHERLVAVIKETVDRIVALEREQNKLKKSLETPRRLEDAKGIKKRIKQIEAELKGIEEMAFTSFRN